jgi:hypothetical protein
MSLERDDQIKLAYARFDRDHSRLRRELLARLAQEDAASPGKDPPPHPGLGPLRIGNWAVGTALGVAAMLVVGVASWCLLAPTDPTARTNLLSLNKQLVNSLYVRGWCDDTQSHPSQ